MPGLIGKKIGMTSVFSADGKNVPCTVIEAGPCVVTQIKTLEKDGYEAIQLGFSEKSEKHTNKAEAGLFKKVGVAPQRHLVEFKGFEGDIKVGAPYVEGAAVTAEVIGDGKAKKVVIYKYKPKKGFHKKKGHRQPFTKLQIKSL